MNSLCWFDRREMNCVACLETRLRAGLSQLGNLGNSFGMRHDTHPPSDAVLLRDYRGSFVFAYLSSDRRCESFANTFDRNSIKNLLKEATDDHSRRLFASEATTASVENLFLVDFRRRAAVRATHVIRFDLESRD